MKHKKKKRSVTLIEIMIVILLIGLIGGALAFNMRGSVEKGKVFKSEQNASRVYDILMMAYATGTIKLTECRDMEKVKDVLSKSPLVKDAKKLIMDGWGDELTIRIINNNNDLDVYSQKARDWQRHHPNQ